MDIKITTLGKDYVFIVNGYRISFKVSAYDTVGMHPLEILEKDLASILEVMKSLERFQTGDKPVEEPKVSLDDVLYSKDDSS